jgi:hypothetical protein
MISNVKYIDNEGNPRQKKRVHSKESVIQLNLLDDDARFRTIVIKGSIPLISLHLTNELLNNWSAGGK